MNRETPSENNSSHEVRILVAEDNRINQRVTRMQIESLGYSVEIAADGSEALERLKSGKEFVLVLMDCQMPNINGYEATREIRQREFGGRRIPIIALTANADKGERDACIDAGMDDFLTKPLTKADLADAIEKWRFRSHEDTQLESDAFQPKSVLESIEARMAEIEEEVGVLDFDDLLCEYVDDTRNGLAELVNAVNRKDLEVIIRTAHSIKGSSLTVGASEVGDTCAKIETLAELEDYAQVRVVLRRLKQEFDEVAAAVEKIIAKNFQLV